ncbi:MAG: FecCD family ABC transporter permease [Fusobacteriaceae bacterium]
MKKSLVSTLFGSLLLITIFTCNGYVPFFQGDFENFKIIFGLRVPRILVAFLTGGLLSVSGVIFQGILFNPLADSYILGIASGASFGASLAMILGVTFFYGYGTIIFAFVFALFSLYVVTKISMKGKRLNSNSLILSGVIVSAFFSAGISFMQFLSGYNGVSRIIFWTMGSFSSAIWSDAFILFFSGTFGIIICLYYGKELNIISLGDRIAKSNGVNVRKTKIILLITASFMAAVAVSISGVIGFIGLITPHLVRGFLGSDNRKVIPLSFMCGGIITMVADNIIRLFFPAEIPIGIITAIIGVPFFIIVFRKKILGDA